MTNVFAGYVRWRSVNLRVRWIVREAMSADPMFPEFVNLAVSNEKGATHLVAPFSLLL
jgi:hypothetical protein